MRRKRTILGILAQQEEEMSEIRTQLADLVTKVNDQKTVIEGVTAILQGLRDQLATAQGNLDAAGEVDASNALTEIMVALDANTEKLAKAAAANTDASDEVHAAGM